MTIQLSFNPYNMLILASVIVGITFGLLLFFVRRSNQKANRFLSGVILIVTLWDILILGIDFNFNERYQFWNWVPFSFLLALGPCLYFYVKLLTLPDFKLSTKTFIHFVPVIVELTVHFFQAYEGWQNNASALNTDIFFLFNPVLQLFSIISILSYLVWSLKELKKFHIWLQDNYSNDLKYQLNWLKRLLSILAFSWVLWVPYTLVDYLFFNYMLTVSDYYPLYIILAFVTIWIGVEAFLRPELILLEPKQKPSKETKEAPTQEILIKADWLKDQVQKNLLYLNSELTLKTLADEIEIHPNVLSKIINDGLGKSFSDFINEYRVKEVINKINDPKYEHITLLGLALECGFNSKTTFNRTFKKITGKTPIAYKNTLKDSI